MLPELSAGSYLEGVVRYDFSFAGECNKEEHQQPATLADAEHQLTGSWFLTLYPSANIRVNYGDPITGQTGRLFLPFDFSVGRSLTRNFTISLEFGAPIIKDYPIYDFILARRFPGTQCSS
jgi:hypothetical protein